MTTLNLRFQDIDEFYDKQHTFSRNFIANIVMFWL